MGQRNRQRVFSIPHAGLQVLGLGIVNFVANVPVLIRFFGCITSITSVVTGDFIVRLSPYQGIYVPMVVGTTNGSAVAGCIRGSSFTVVAPSTVTMTLDMFGVGGQDKSFVGIVICGFNP